MSLGRAEDVPSMLEIRATGGLFQDVSVTQRVFWKVFVLANNQMWWLQSL